MRIDNETVYNDIHAALLRQPILPNGTRELMNVTLVFNSYERITKAREAYINHELDWYLSRDLNICAHDGIKNNPIWLYCATETGNVNSNYGWCIFDKDNCSQYDNAVASLVKDKYTRQSCCIYTRPTIQIQHNDNTHARHDFICTYSTQHMIRDDTLHYSVLMRSNDIDFGLPYDLAWHQYVYSMMYTELKHHYPDLAVGTIHWFAVSLHKYIRNEGCYN